MTVTIRIAGRWVYRMRRVLATSAIVLLTVLLGYKVVFGANGMRVWQNKRAEAQHLEKQIARQQAEHDALERRVNDLQTAKPSAIEKEAREQLGYVKPGEVVLFEQRTMSDPRQPAVAENNTQK